jgi:site-specific DNA-methyltransferase (adenine-specific)
MAYEIVLTDCMDWLQERGENSVHAVVTDPPFGMREYMAHEVAKLRAGRGGVWRIPPKIGGSQRRPLPRFTVLSAQEVEAMSAFFYEWGRLIHRVLVPGGHVFIASNPLVSHAVFTSLAQAGLEKRGEIIRLVRTLRGGDRPKNAEEEFPNVSAMPRSCWEPWGLFRKPFEGTLADNLRKWWAGGLRRLSPDSPFPDVLVSGRTPEREREIAPHPSLKPQEFMRRIVWASLPLGKGIVLDPFAGAGTTLAAAEHFGYNSIGLEVDSEYAEMAKTAVPVLARLPVEIPENGILNGRQATLFAAAVDE